jgi:hypothetical protein
LLRPFRAWLLCASIYPGLQPGLVCCALSGLGCCMHLYTQAYSLGWFVAPFQGLGCCVHLYTQAYSLGWFVAPFQGLVVVCIYIPRPTAWAGLLRPFRAWLLCASIYPGLQPGLVCCALSGVVGVCIYIPRPYSLGWFVVPFQGLGIVCIYIPKLTAWAGLWLLGCCMHLYTRAYSLGWFVAPFQGLVVGCIICPGL